MSNETGRQFWRIDRVRQETGLCTSSIYAGMTNGSFPASFPIGAQAVAWVSDEVEAWKAARLAERDALREKRSAEAKRRFAQRNKEAA